MDTETMTDLQEQQTGTSEQENDHSDIGIKISPAEEIYESNRDMKSDHQIKMLKITWNSILSHWM